MTAPLQDIAMSAWEAFRQVGGTDSMYNASTFGTEAQAYYAGQVWAYNRVLFKMGLGMVGETHVDYDELDKMYADYVG